jgi:predicted lipase
MNSPTARMKVYGMFSFDEASKCSSFTKDTIEQVRTPAMFNAERCKQTIDYSTDIDEDRSTEKKFRIISEVN